jgi:hypothetical protein
MRMENELLYRIDQKRMNEKSSMGMYRPANDRAVEHFERLREQKVLVPMEYEVVAVVEADVSYDDPDPGDQKYSLHVDDLPYPGEYRIVCVCEGEHE